MCNRVKQVYLFYLDFKDFHLLLPKKGLFRNQSLVYKILFIGCNKFDKFFSV